MQGIVSKTIPPTIAVVLIVLALPVAEAATVQADLAADRIQGQGMIQGTSNLTALLHPHTSSTGASLSGLELTADQVRVETDYAEVSVVVAEASVNAKPLPDTRVDHHAHATAWSTGVGSGFRFDVLPLEIGSAQASIHASCAAVAPPNEDQHSRTVIVQSESNRADYTVDASQSIQWEACGDDATATVTGDFWFSAWAIGLKVEDENGAHEYWSGHRDDEPITEDQELYVYVTNGTLQVPLGMGAGYGLFLESGGTTEVSGSVQLSNAHGSLTTPTGNVDLGGDSVTLEGDLELTTQRGDALQVALTGDADGAMIDGKAWQALTVAPGDASNAWPWPWIVVFAAAAAVAGVAWHRPNQIGRVAGYEYDFSTPASSRRQRRGLGYWLMALQANNHERHRRSLFYAGRALALFPDLPEAHKMRGVALAHLGRHVQALDLLVDSYDGLPGGLERAQAACTAALCCLRLGESVEAVAWLRRGFSEDAWFVLEHVRRRVYDEIRDDPWLRMVTEGSRAVAREVHDTATGSQDVAFS